MSDHDDEYDDDEKASTPAPAIRRFAVFLDGLERAMILPMGPSLLLHHFKNDADGAAAAWNKMPYYLSCAIAVYSLGRWFGLALSSSLVRMQQQQSNEKCFATVARLGGFAISLHVFAYGAGLVSIGWLLAMRLCSGMLVGFICGLTTMRSYSLPQDIDERDADISRGTFKVYLTGFAISVLSGGLLFPLAIKGVHTYQLLAGYYTFTVWPIFFLTLAKLTERILVKTFEASRPQPRLDRVYGKKMEVHFGTPSPRQTLSNEHQREISQDVEEADAFAESDELFQPFTLPNRSRNRTESSFSQDEFFDCVSAFSDTEANFLFDTDNELGRVAVYRDNKCVYSDGSPAFVPQGNCAEVIPFNYYNFFGGDKYRAHVAWVASQRWRYEMSVWKIHRMPNRWFAPIKEAYPHFIHGHSKLGYPVIYEQPGRMNLKELFRSGCEIDDMVHHYTFFMEFISNCVCTSDEIRSMMGPDTPAHNSSSWGVMVVMDIAGAGPSHLSGDVIKCKRYC
jgi:hypothetical protein